MDAEERARLRAFLVALKLRGKDVSEIWNACIVCGWPTQMPYACQTAPDEGDGLADWSRKELQQANPSGRNCWFDKKLISANVKHARPYDFGAVDVP